MVKRLKGLLLAVVILIYGFWVYTGPLDTLAMRYGDSGKTWGTLVFGLMIPYCAYFIFNIVQSRKKKNSGDQEPGE